MNTKICPTCKAPIPANAPGGLCPACVLRGADEPAPAGRAAPPLAEIAAAFPQLEIQSLIGQGGMGFVYRARQPALDRTVALKILAPELGRDPAFAERFAREARVLGKLNHANIVTVFEHGISQSSTPDSQPFYYLLMEFVDGVNLRQAMRAGRFTPQQALAVVPGICDALQAAHAQGVWHRDIKPENILLDARGGVKIADFGIARIVGDPVRDFTLTSTGAALGSAPYMAPEQHEKPHDVDHRADIYSLGVVIYEMLTGELPLGRFPAPSQRAAVSARIDEIVLQTLEKERELRQQSAAEVKTDVTRAARTAGERTPVRNNDEPATITQWSMGLALGGIVMFLASAVLTHGSTQEVLHTFAILALVLGFVGSCIALSKMAHGKISQRWRGGLRGLVWSPPVIVGLFTLSLIIYMIPARQTAQDEARRTATEVAPPGAGLKAQPSRGSLPGNLPSAKSLPSSTPPGLPAIPVEEVFRKMNAAANESNGEEFRKHMAALSSERMTAGLPMARFMEPFFGRVRFVKVVPAEPGKPTRVPIIAGSGIERPGAAETRILAGIEKLDGQIQYVEFGFTAEQGEWRYVTTHSPQYRAMSRVEFRPKNGDAATILRTHLRPGGTLVPVKDADGQFDIAATHPDVTVATDNATMFALHLEGSLKQVGLDGVFKIIKRAEKPVKPWMAEDEPPGTKPEPPKEAGPVVPIPPAAPLPTPEKRNP